MSKFSSLASFCPACLFSDKVGKVVAEGEKLVCSLCGQKYPANAVLISEDTLRIYAKTNDANHLLTKLEEK